MTKQELLLEGENCTECNYFTNEICGDGDCECHNVAMCENCSEIRMALLGEGGY